MCSALTEAVSINNSSSLLPNSRYNRQSGMHKIHTSRMAAKKPSWMRGYFLAPIFCAVKLEMPFPIVVKEVITRLFSFTAAEYPAAVLTPKLLMQPWIIIFPTDIKDCCKMLGTATAHRFWKRRHEKKQTPVPVFMPDRRLKISSTEQMQLTPWQKKVAQATPATPICNVFTNSRSVRIFAVEEKARNKNGVLESPRAEKIPVAIL